MNRVKEKREEARATQIRSNEASTTASEANISGLSPNLFPIPVILSMQAKNQLLNGDDSHSVNTWNDATPSGGDRDKECAWWFSNDAPVLGQELDPVTS